MILILNDDGSLYYLKKDEYINQHSNNVNYLDFAFVNLTNEDYTTDLYVELPNKTSVILQGETKLFTCNNKEYQGFRTYFSDEITIYGGTIKVIVRTYDVNNNVLYSYALPLTINATSSVEYDDHISETEYQKLLSKLNNYLLKYDSHLIRKYDSLALANNDIDNIATNSYVLIDGDNYTLYKKNNGSLVEVLYSQSSIEGLTDLLKTFANNINGLSNSLYLLNDDDKIGNTIVFKTINGNSLIGQGNIATIERSELDNFYNKEETDNLYIKKEEITPNSSNEIDETLYKIEILGKVYKISYKEKTSELTNDSGFITNAVSDLLNYYTKAESNNLLADKVDNSTLDNYYTKSQVYLKTETYTQDEVNALINALKTITFETYDSYDDLPEAGESNVIYLVSHSHEQESDIKDEYIWLEDSSKYELIGNTDIDLSSYATNERVEKVEVRVSTNENNISSLTTSLSSLTTSVNSHFNSANEEFTSIKLRLTTAETDIDNLTNSLNSEISTREKNDTTLQSNIDTEKTRAATAENTLTTNLNSEITRAKAKEDELENNINTNATSITNLTNTLNEEVETLETALNDEATTRTTNDATLQTMIEEEASRAKNQEGVLQTNIDNVESAIPTKTSQLTNDSGFAYTTNLSSYYTKTQTDVLLKTKQDNLTSSASIDITENVVSLNSDYIRANQDGDATTTLNNIKIGDNVFLVKYATKLSEFTNDSGYITSSYLTDNNYATTSDIPTKVSELTNDSNYVVQNDLTNTLANYATITSLNSVKSSIPTTVSQLTNDSNYITKTNLTSTLSSYALSSDIPTKTSVLTNDSGFITNEVNDLTNYLTSDNTYDRETIKSLIAAALPTAASWLIVDTLPDEGASNIIYLVKDEHSENDLYNEYIWVEVSGVGQWEKLGNTDIDLSDFVKTTTLTSTLTSYALLTDLPTKTSSLTNDSGYITTSALTDYAKTSSLPTKVSDLENDTGFITTSALSTYATISYVDEIANTIPTKVSELTNDSGYLVSTALSSYATKTELTTVENKIPTKVSSLTNDSGYITSSSLSPYALQTSLDTTNSNVSTNATNIATNTANIDSLESSLSNYVLTSALTTTLANSSLTNTINATKLSGFSLSNGNSQGILYVRSDGVVKTGRYFDFHYIGSSNDYDVRLQAGGQTSNTVTLPTTSGTLALTSEIPTALSSLTNDTSYTTLTEVKSTCYTKTEVDVLLAEKQDTLTAGTGITISNNVISSTASYETATNSEIDALFS